MRPGPDGKQKPRFRWGFIAATILLVLIGVSLAKEYARSYQIKQEIDSLRDQIASLESDNRATSDFVEYLKTDSYFEKQARLKMGLKAPGEKVLVIVDAPLTARNTHAVSGALALQTYQRDNRVNPLKWLDYFFGPPQ